MSIEVHINRFTHAKINLAIDFRSTGSITCGGLTTTVSQFRPVGGKGHQFIKRQGGSVVFDAVLRHQDTTFTGQITHFDILERVFHGFLKQTHRRIGRIQETSLLEQFDGTFVFLFTTQFHSTLHQILNLLITFDQGSGPTIASIGFTLLFKFLLLTCFCKLLLFTNLDT